MIIGIDFDGTCVSHEFPVVGKNIGSVPVLKELVANGHQLVLFTVRSNHNEPASEYDEVVELTNRNYLSIAENWFKDNNIPLYGVNVNPNQVNWSNSPKAHCHIYIDDAALGCPLIYGDSQRPYVDWSKVRDELIARGFIK